jgi:uncharacterized protein
LIDLGVVLVAGTAVLVGAVIQGAVGFGVAMVAAPVVTLLDPTLMPGALLVVVFLLPLLSLPTEHRHVDRQVVWVLAGRVVGTLPGVVIVSLLPPDELAIGIAVLILLAAGLSLRTITVPRTRATLVGAGFVSAIGATAGSIGGPPLALVYQRADARMVRSTVAVIFLFGSSLSMVALAAAGEMGRRELLTGLAFFPFFAAGFALSLPLRRYLGGAGFRHAVLGVVAASALAVLVKPALG